jgi:mannose-6-phosphate isomerase-like protein (cupin superfamily)
MRIPLVFLGPTVLLCIASDAASQDLFGSVTVEPRPEEYIHWDATAFAEVQSGLEQRIADGERTWDTRFVFERVLPATEYRPHNISIVHREGYTQPEIHELKWDLYVILDGSGTLLVGGERTNWIGDGRPPAEQHPGLSGAQAFEVTQGDIVHVPARVWHQVVLEPGQAMTYMLINVMEEADSAP